MLRGHENLSFAHVFKHCGLKTSDFEQSAVKENSFRTHVKMVLIERMSTELIYFCHFIGLERFNTHTCMCQNAHLCKYLCVRFGMYLGSGVTVRYNFGTTGKKKEIYYAQFLFIYCEQTVVQIKKKIHLNVKILNIITCYIYKICFVFIVSVQK